MFRKNPNPCSIKTLGSDSLLAPQVGLEPTTTRLTAESSAIELLRNMESGSDLSSRAVSSQVLSALKGLTAVFGMGTGGTPSSLPPEMVSYSFRRLLPLPDCRIVAPFRFPVKPLRSLRLPVPLALSCTLTTAHRMIQLQTVFQLVSSLSFGLPKRPSAVIKPSTY